MNILAFDTSTDILAMALLSERGNRAYSADGELKHAAELLPLADRLLAETGLKPGDLDLVVCAQGPGSFTGLRIGLATAKGIAMGAGVPLVSVPTLDAYAEPFTAFPGLVVPIIDARKGRIYSAIYAASGRVSGWMDIAFQGLVPKLGDAPRVLFTGPAADLAQETVQARAGWEIDPGYRFPRIEYLAFLGKRRYDVGMVDEPSGSPLYVRKDDADLGITMAKPAR
jgi:tRNA threonylcarbamoyladenosine biosynthesis protein TsaB